MKRHPIDQHNIDNVLQKLVEKIEEGTPINEVDEKAISERQRSYKSPKFFYRKAARPSLVIERQFVESDDITMTPSKSSPTRSTKANRIMNHTFHNKDIVFQCQYNLLTPQEAYQPPTSHPTTGLNLTGRKLTISSPNQM